MLPNPAPQALPILYSFRRCPYAIRARLAIRAAGIGVALREVVLRDKPAALIALSPKATVPVLQLPAGAAPAMLCPSPFGLSLSKPGAALRQAQCEREGAPLVIDQSLDIMRWALGQHDPQGWLRTDEHDAAQALIAINDGPFKTALDRYKYAPRHPDRPAHAWRDEAVALLLAPMDARLAQHRFLLRDTPSLADMAIVPFVRQFAAVDGAWFDGAPLPHVRAWMRGITASPLFASVMPKFAAWRPGDADVAF